MTESIEPSTIGWRECVDLPDWGIEGIEAKSDTGARSSAIDVKNLRFEGDDTVTFEVALSRTDRSRTRPVHAKVKRRTVVKSSNGHVSDRIVVETTLQVGRVVKTIDVSLVCRKRMQCRMLIGRTALQEHFVVDSSKTYLLTESKSKPRRKKSKTKRKKIKRDVDRSEDAAAAN
ncbi:ATP-dependent zinc protease family protein [Rubinisphaera margarita]|uniref:ATP-dependent zinc protease family protein n=1 Tax=Rubinisphaera margarita TaxID=2909586 RepID=UPI001EE88FB9|nr:RimK/LysX family protein [Rubinisphaera margarita]MCG6157187.1 RimK/LysX family protein [Rubinisphaera margarita]